MRGSSLTQQSNVFTDPNNPDVATIQGLEGIFQNVISVAVALAGIVLFVTLIIGGINILTAGADPQKAEAGKKTVTAAIGGMVFIALSYLILRLIATLTGTENILLNFTVRQ